MSLLVKGYGLTARLPVRWYHIPKGRVSRCETRPLALHFTAFCKAKDGLSHRGKLPFEDAEVCLFVCGRCPLEMRSPSFIQPSASAAIADGQKLAVKRQSPNHNVSKTPHSVTICHIPSVVLLACLKTHFYP